MDRPHHDLSRRDLLRYGAASAMGLTAAGALTYSQYNFVLKFVLKQIARRAGFTGDTKHDYEFTNWPALDRFVDETAQSARVGSPC